MSTFNKAGKASGRERALRAKWRRLSVLQAFGRLKSAYQFQPYSDEAIDALEEELRKDALQRKSREKLARDLWPDDKDGIVDSWVVRNASDLTRNPHPPKRPPPHIEQQIIVLANECIHETYEEMVRSRNRSNKGRSSGARRRNEIASRETLKQDLKVLGVRSQRRKKRLG
jgi:hypothetical protein